MIPQWHRYIHVYNLFNHNCVISHHAGNSNNIGWILDASIRASGTNHHYRAFIYQPQIPITAPFRKKQFVKPSLNKALEPPLSRPTEHALLYEFKSLQSPLHKMIH